MFWLLVIVAAAAAAPQTSDTVRAPTSFRNAELQGAGSYGLTFVAPASYGYGDRGGYDAAAPSQFGFQGPAASGLGPGKYSFPVFDHNQGYGGFGALGYYGVNLGFAFPGYGYGNGIFGARAYPNPFV